MIHKKCPDEKNMKLKRSGWADWLEDLVSNPNLNPDSNPNLNPDSNPNLNPDSNPNLNPDSNPNLNSHFEQFFMRPTAGAGAAATAAAADDDGDNDEAAKVHGKVGDDGGPHCHDAKKELKKNF